MRSNPTGINFDIKAAPIRWNKGAVVPKGLEKDVEAEINEMLQTSGYAEKLEAYEAVQKEIKETKQWIDQAQKTMTEQNLWSNPDIKAQYNKKYNEMIKSQSELFPLNMEINKIQSTAQAQARNAVWTENNKVLVEQVKAVEDLNKMIEAKVSELLQAPSWRSWCRIKRGKKQEL